MTRSLRLAAISFLPAAVVALPATALAIGSPRTAAVQVALRAQHLYSGPVNGEAGPSTRAAVVALQRRTGLVPDGIVGRRTMAALGPLARPALGTRWLGPGAVGGDVV